MFSETWFKSQTTVFFNEILTPSIVGICMNILINYNEASTAQYKTEHFTGIWHSDAAAWLHVNSIDTKRT